MCTLAAEHTGFWVSCGDEDNVVGYSNNQRFVNAYNNCTNRNSNAVFNTIVGGGHDATSFNGAYSTTSTTFYPTLYEWLLLNQRGVPQATLPPTPPPTGTPGPTRTPTVPPPTTAPCLTPSPNCYSVGRTGGICDAYGNTWSISTRSQVAVNGLPDLTTANVIKLAYVNGYIWQENQSGDWYAKHSVNDGWSEPPTQIDPTLNCVTPPPTSPPTPGPTSLPTSPPTPGPTSPPTPVPTHSATSSPTPSPPPLLLPPLLPPPPPPLPPLLLPPPLRSLDNNREAPHLLVSRFSLLFLYSHLFLCNVYLI
eukprot:Phypoly_transcript_09182.p1 GENE.Phypoly_transcript_09182~~Phypoly_transcript_09182.p1  ORF type:complete len:308 (+),score=67.82 Phypoly_transcript_09182:494-1417(+)